MTKINYRLISEAEEYYTHFNQGFEYVETPIWVCLGAVKATLPEGREAFRVDNMGWLVGSAEQGFIDMAMENKLKFDQLYCSTTPCFRNEKEDETHQKWFVKNELFLLTEQSKVDCTREFFIDSAQSFFKKYLDTDVVYIGGFDDQYDIVDSKNKIELGSYGIREFTIGNWNMKWVYGTGCAEPRLSYVLDKQ